MAQILRLALIALTDGSIVTVQEATTLYGILTPSKGQGIVVVNAYPTVSRLPSAKIVSDYQWNMEAGDFIAKG